MVGAYEEDGQTPISHIVLHPDGSFSDYTERPSRLGHWKLVDRDYLFGPELRFEGGNDSSSYGDEYLLTRKAGRVCIEPSGDDGDPSSYWCNTR
jgi:hypothetical protein